MIDARKFALPLNAPPGASTFHFGADGSTIARELRDFADKVEAGAVLVQSVQTGSVVKPDDYITHGVFIEYATKVEA